jgi:GNAT superfamily N-acetyltransferase
LGIEVDPRRHLPEHARVLQIRSARPEDAAALEALYRELIENPRIAVTPSHVDAIVANPRNFLLVASDTLAGEGVLGTLFMTICPDPMFARACYALVEDVVVTAGARNRGIGAQLFAHAEAIAARERCNRVMLLSASHRSDAHRFFRRAGYDGDRKVGFVKYLPRRGE